MVLIVSMILALIIISLGVPRIRSIRYAQISKESFARWSMLDTLEKKRLLSHCCPDKDVPEEENSMDILFDSFLENKWMEMRAKRFYDFDAFRIYLSKLFTFACRMPEQTAGQGAQRLS